LSLDQERAVLVQASRRNLIDDFSGAWRQADQIAVTAKQNLRHAGTAGERRMFGKMQRFAMSRDKDIGPHPTDHIEQFVASGMAGYIDKVGPVGNDLDALFDQPIDYPRDALLVTRDRAR